MVEVSSFESEKEAIDFVLKRLPIGMYVNTYFSGHKTIFEVINIMIIVAISSVTKSLKNELDLDSKSIYDKMKNKDKRKIS